MSKKNTIIALLLAAGILTTYFFYSHPDPVDGKLEEPTSHQSHHSNELVLSREQIQSMNLQFSKAGPEPLFLTLSTRGKIIIQPDHLAHIIPKVSGVAREIYKNIGDDVNKGEVMVEIESRDIADIKAALLAALSKQRLAASSLAREERLYREKVSAQQDLLNAKNIYEESLINVQLAKQKLKAFGLTDEEVNTLISKENPDLSLYLVRSPFAGTVIMRHVTQGEFIENTKTIFEIADLSSVWVEIGIYPKDLHKVREGQEVEILLPIENRSAKASLIYVSPVIEQETITSKAIARLRNVEGQWRPGVLVKVNIATEEFTPSVAVPLDILQNIKGKDVLFVKTSKGLEMRPVQLGLRDEKNVEVTAGLRVGEEYATHNTFLLKSEMEKSSIEND